jgi:hypothetical protein
MGRLFIMQFLLAVHARMRPVQHRGLCNRRMYVGLLVLDAPAGE